ncbi:integrase [Dactylosporangium sp. CA-152071]|uniref:integrase n=1 Tax=Dactylosporangium sp. CA-152071 TaxID=3239933 RepID=UPI003D92613E
MGGISPHKAAASCAECFAWGVLPGSCCRACYTFRGLHDRGECSACRRVVPVNKGYCRLCWLQALHDAKAAGHTHVSAPFLHAVRHQQLFFARMHRDFYRLPGRERLGKRGRRAAPAPAAAPERPAASWVQLRLPFHSGRDFVGFDRRRHADLTNPALVQARHIAQALAASRGWSRWVAKDVDRALVILLSGHNGDDRLRYTELAPALRLRGLTIERTIDVLDRAGLFHDDKPAAFDAWLDRKLGALPPAIRTTVEAWLRTLRDGGPRTRARNPETAWSYLNAIRPLLLHWSDQHAHLREVTRQDVLDATATLHGSKRHITLSILRSLFRHAKKTGTIFRDPTTRIRPTRVEPTAILPLQPADIHEAINAATTPAYRVAVVLATVHAARSKDILTLRLDDVDIGNRRLVLAGRVRPLDNLTRDTILEWLEQRRTRWPNTANPHLLINRITALETGPVSRVWITRAFWGLTATLERLHTDRQLEEALVHGPDPLHLTAVFGIHENTAIRYAHAARQILEQGAEQHDTGSP